ncbi:unnamed protein product [Protopolystoma xenopodis]|uniref:Uncharacterized protein n=1 Tax=Protopolystoma xenopodis TaxID=117903 RepID=A0A448XQS6_9PLAT|nr:unnamed protein product [Protopolystoma xenopodis]
MVEHLAQQLSEEYNKYRDEADARRILISDINELREQFDDMSIAKKHALQSSREGDDPIILRLALQYSMAKPVTHA